MKKNHFEYNLEVDDIGEPWVKRLSDSVSQACDRFFQSRGIDYQSEMLFSKKKNDETATN